MNIKTFLKVFWIGLLLAICGCQQEKSSNSDAGFIEKRTEEKILESRLQRLQNQRYLHNEPVAFRKIKFGAHIGSVKRKHDLEFIRTGYEISNQKGSHTQITQTEVEVSVNGKDVLISYPEQHRCMSCLSQNGKRAKIYRIRGDKLSIGSIPLESIFYHFYNESFCGVEIRFDGKHWGDMEKLFISRFGDKEDPLDLRLEWHMWEGEKIYIKLWTVPQNETTKKGFIEYCYLPLREEDQERYGREMLREAKYGQFPK